MALRSRWLDVFVWLTLYCPITKAFTAKTMVTPDWITALWLEYPTTFSVIICAVLLRYDLFPERNPQNNPSQLSRLHSNLGRHYIWKCPGNLVLPDYMGVSPSRDFWPLLFSNYFLYIKSNSQGKDRWYFTIFRCPSRVKTAMIPNINCGISTPRFV